MIGRRSTTLESSRTISCPSQLRSKRETRLPTNEKPEERHRFLGDFGGASIAFHLDCRDRPDKSNDELRPPLPLGKVCRRDSILRFKITIFTHRMNKVIGGLHPFEYSLERLSIKNIPVYDLGRGRESIFYALLGDASGSVLERFRSAIASIGALQYSPWLPSSEPNPASVTPIKSSNNQRFVQGIEALGYQCILNKIPFRRAGNRLTPRRITGRILDIVPKCDRQDN